MTGRGAGREPGSRVRALQRAGRSRRRPFVHPAFSKELGKLPCLPLDKDALSP